MPTALNDLLKETLPLAIQLEDSIRHRRAVGWPARFLAVKRGLFASF